MWPIGRKHYQEVKREEVRELADRIRAQMATGIDDSHALKVADEPRTRDGFVRYRFEERWVRYDKRAPFYGRVNGVFKAISAATGLALSGGVAIDALTSTFWWQALLFILGLVGVVTATVDQTWRPSVRNAAYNKARDALREEGWMYVCGLGRYALVKDAAAQRGAFEEAILAIQAEGASGLRDSGPSPS